MTYRCQMPTRAFLGCGPNHFQSSFATVQAVEAALVAAGVVILENGRIRSNCLSSARGA